MRNIAEFTLIGRVGTIKQVGKTVRVSVCANYPFKDDKGQWKDDAHWNEVTIFTKAIQSYVSEHVSKGDLVHVRGRLRQNSYERDGQRVYTVDLIALEVGRLAQASERAADSRLPGCANLSMAICVIASDAQGHARLDFSFRLRTPAHRNRYRFYSAHDGHRYR